MSKLTEYLLWMINAISGFIGSIVCALRGYHVWRYGKGLELKRCRLCQTVKTVKRRKKEVA